VQRPPRRLALALGLAWLLPACCSSDTGRPDSGDGTTGTWTIGPVEPCEDPAPSATWSDRSELLWGADRDHELGQPAACAALVRGEQDWIVAVTTAESDLAWRSLDGSVSEQREMTPKVVRLRVEDLDGDGQLDALAFSRSLQVGWSFATGEAQWEVLYDEDAGCEFREVGVIDLEGDGDLDLVVPDLLACEDEQAWDGAVLANLGDRVFGGPEPLDGVSFDFWGVAFDALAMDIDEDGDQDLYVCHDLGREIAENGWLYNTDGVLAEGDDRGSDVATHCMGVSVGDVDQDGSWDLYIAANREHFLLLGSDAGWTDHARAWGLPSYDSEQMSWGSAFADLDNDGLLDLVATTSDFIQGDPIPYPIWILRQVATGVMEEVGAAWGFAQQTVARGVVVTDLDGDGVVDLVVADALGTPWLYLSDGCTADNWVEVEAPRASLVTVEADGRRWRAVATPEPGFGASQPPVVHIGLGDVDVIDRVVVEVPYRDRAVFEGPLEARRRLLLE